MMLVKGGLHNNNPMRGVTTYPIYEEQILNKVNKEWLNIKESL